MIRPPFGVRLILGVAATVLEETRKLPQAVLTYPMTAASQAVQNFMRFQQTVTELAIKGDETWENIFPPPKSSRSGRRSTRTSTSSTPPSPMRHRPPPSTRTPPSG